MQTCVLLVFEKYKKRPKTSQNLKKRRFNVLNVFETSIEIFLKPAETVKKNPLKGVGLF